MKIIALLTLLLSHGTTNAFSPSSSSSPQKMAFRPSTSHLFSQTTNNNNANDGMELSRRDIFQTTAMASLLTLLPSSPARAEEEGTTTAIKSVVVAGATGQTGSRIYTKLLSDKTLTAVTGGVRNVDKASKSLPPAGTLSHLDVVEDSLDDLTKVLTNSDALIIACGMNPGKNLMRMSAAAHEVDNLGTIKLIDAAKAAGVKKVVLVSSILTNGRAWGQEKSPGFVATNAFGGALDEKLAAELYLRGSGMDYTIVRPGGLKGKAPVGALSVNGEDTLNAGEISRDLVADVCIASLTDGKASNKVLEIIEDEGVPARVFNGLNM